MEIADSSLQKAIGEYVEKVLIWLENPDPEIETTVDAMSRTLGDVFGMSSRAIQSITLSVIRDGSVLHAHYGREILAQIKDMNNPKTRSKGIL